MARKGTWVLNRRKTRRTDVAGSDRRLVAIRVALVLVLLVAGGRLVVVQGFEASALSERSEKQRSTTLSVPAERGSIMDHNGNVLAFSSEVRKLYVQPRELGRAQDEEHAKNPKEPTGDQYKQEIARYAHQVAGDELPEHEVRDALFKDAKFTYFGPLLDPNKARQITEKYPEIGSEYRSNREYPAGNVGANVVGAANWRSEQGTIRGLLGLEGAMDEQLSGQDGEQIADTARSSNLVIPGTERAGKPAIPGSDVRLTLDSDLQFTAQRKLADYVAKSQSEGGSAVVLDAKTGQVRAMANDQSFDPANSDTWTGEGLRNDAVTTPFEPGSVNKLITAAGAIEDGITKPEDVRDVPGKIKIADRTIKDAWSHGTLPMTFTGVLGKSSNVGTLQTAQKLGADRFNDLVKRFGLGHKTGIELAGESAGSVPPRDEWSGSTFANLPIGQGLSMTTLQMTGMFQAIANDGVRVPPRVVDSTVGPDGKPHERPQPPGTRVVSSQTAHTVRDMLRAVVQDDPKQRGTGPDAALDGYQVSGKTGTAQQIDPKCQCYSDEKQWSTFAGMVPAQDPRFVVGIMLDNPQAKDSHLKSAAPLFHDLASNITRRHQIPLSPEPAPVQTLQLPQDPNR